MKRAVLSCALAAWPARAAPPEVLSGIALHPTDPDRVVLSYAQGGQGLLFSSDGGRSFALRCGSAVSASFTKSRAPLALTHDGEALLGTFEGLVRGRTDGCGFGMDAGLLSGLQVADFAPDPRDVTVTFLATANARDGRATGLVRRDSSGSLSPLGPSVGADAGGAEVSITRLGIGLRADGGLRFYASALRADPTGEYLPVIQHSDDEGASWVSYDVPNADGARVLLVGVDPTDPDRLAIALSREAGHDHVLLSSDRGRSLEPRLEIFELGASSVGPDGRLWVGDAGGEAEYSQPGGLYLFDDFAAPARQLATFPVRCLGYRAEPEALFACQRSSFGRVEPATGHFTQLSSFSEVGAFADCAGEELAVACKQQLCDNWCGVLHHASAPLCDAYSELSPLCGPPARGLAGAAPPSGNEALPLPGDGPASTFDAGAMSGAAPEPARGVARPAEGDTACRFGASQQRSRTRHGLAAACAWFASMLLRRARRR